MGDFTGERAARVAHRVQRDGATLLREIGALRARAIVQVPSGMEANKAFNGKRERS